MRGPILENALMRKIQPAKTFLLVKDKGKCKSKVASSSTNLMTLEGKLPTWKPSKIYTP